MTPKCFGESLLQGVLERIHVSKTRLFHWDPIKQGQSMPVEPGLHQQHKTLNAWILLCLRERTDGRTVGAKNLQANAPQYQENHRNATRTASAGAGWSYLKQ